MSDGREIRFWHRLLRFAVQVPILVLVYLVPGFLGMDEALGEPIRKTAAGALLIAIARWVSIQGRRRNV
jgi:hypothetical protein